MNASKIVKLSRFGIVIMCSMWLFVLNIASANREYSYKIIYASNSINHWETKNQILEIYDVLTNRVDEEYYYEIISQGIGEFQVGNHSSVIIENNKIIVTIGDGKGLVVEGAFENQCKVEVKRKSLLLSLFGK